MSERMTAAESTAYPRRTICWHTNLQKREAYLRAVLEEARARGVGEDTLEDLLRLSEAGRIALLTVEEEGIPVAGITLTLSEDTLYLGHLYAQPATPSVNARRLRQLRRALLRQLQAMVEVRHVRAFVHSRQSRFVSMQQAYKRLLGFKEMLDVPDGCFLIRQKEEL